jgi:DNA-binding NarL/FixJ family response regulator
MNPTNIIIAEGNDRYRNEIKNYLETHFYSSIIGEVSSGEAFLRLGNINNKADIVVMDINVFKSSGQKLIQRMSILFPKVKIITLVTRSDYKYIVNLMGLNVKEIVFKSSFFTDIIPALERVLKAKTVLNND